MQQPKGRKYTYADYQAWDDGNRYELIDGEVYDMSPAPTRTHQAIVGALFTQLYNHLKGKACKVFVAPFDVILSEDTVVQPDIVVIYDGEKLREDGCHGAPDMVVEVLSPSSGNRDRLVKYQLYEAAGVREYWVVSPHERLVQVSLLRDGSYANATRPYGEAEAVPVTVLEGCAVELAEVFPPVEAAVREPEGV